MNSSVSANDTVGDFTEVEQKFSLLSPDVARARLVAFGGQPRGTRRQRDVYFDAPTRSFLANPTSSEWLRLRHQDDAVTLNYKLWYPLDEAVKTHCDEFETRVANGEAMRLTLEALGYSELVVVAKTRDEWALDDVLVAIDEVEGLGGFIEFEYAGRGCTVDEAHRVLSRTVARLDLALGPSHEGYPHQLLAVRP